MNIPALLLSDGYKYGHHAQYPDNTTLVYTNWTPRSNYYAPSGCDKAVSIGQQLLVRWLVDTFNNEFFWKDEDSAVDYIVSELSLYLGSQYDGEHFRKLHRLGYLPLHIKSLPEGTVVPMKIPMLTMYNTLPEFYWLPNFLETIISNMLWQISTSATIALGYKKSLMEFALETDKDNIGFVDFQGHDFSMRGLSGDTASVLSGLGHAAVFSGSDSLPAVYGARKYYDAEGFVIGSVNATEHSVMCAGGKEDEYETYKRLINEVHPKGILSIVSDTWDLWGVLTSILPRLKNDILTREGKVVIRPDSGDPVDILCGREIMNSEDIERTFWHNTDYKKLDKSVIEKDGKYYSIDIMQYPDGGFRDWDTDEEFSHNQVKGVIELLWDTFGGTINEQGYKVLDPHIGAIYGDSITPERQVAICEILKKKGFASTNVVLGIGSYTYQFKTRDTFGFAMKATYVEINTYEEALAGIHNGRSIFKDPKTDDGVKKSAKGLLQVTKVVGAHGTSDYILKDECTWEEEAKGSLTTIFCNGVLANQVNWDTIKRRLKIYG